MSPHRLDKNQSESPLDGTGYLREDSLPPSWRSGVRRSLNDPIRRLAISTRYARERMHGILRVHGWHFIVFSLLMRLPTATVMLAVMMMLAFQNGEATLGGYAAGTIGLSAALMVPFYRWLSGRLGQRRVLFATTLLNLPALVWLLLESLGFAGSGEGSIPRFLAAATVTGLTTVPLGSVMRAYWNAEYEKTEDRRKLNSSISLETVLDVIALPSGAVIAGLSTIFINAQASIFSVMAINVLGLLMILWRPDSLPIEQRTLTEPTTKPLRWGNRSLLWMPQLGNICLGIVLGSTQASVVAFALSIDRVSATGLLVTLLGLSAVVSAVFVLFERFPMFSWGAWLISGVWLVISAIMISLPSSVPGLIPALVGVGLAYGVCLVTMDSISTSLSVRKNLDLALSTMHACSVGGTAVSFVWAADLSESYTYQVALLIPLAAAALYFVLGHVFGFIWRQMYEERLAPLPPRSASTR